MPQIPVTSPIPGRSVSQGGGEGLEHTRLVNISEAQLFAIRANTHLAIPAVPDKLTVVKYAVFWAENTGPGMTLPSGSSFRLHYGETTRSIIERATGFLGAASTRQVHIDYADGDDEVSFSNASQPIRVDLTGGTGEITAGSGAGGGLRIRLVYDLIDASA